MRIAPALTSGFAGRPVSGSRLMALNGSPLGSAPTRADTSAMPSASTASAYTNGFEIDWIVNGTSDSPAAYTSPSWLSSTIPNASGSAYWSSGM